MTLTIQTPTTRLEGEDRRYWLERTTPEQRKTVAGYELHSYVPIRCIGHIDKRDCLFISLERWIDYSTGRRDIQRVQLLLNSSGDITSLHRYPLEITQWGNPAGPEPTAELEPEQPTLRNSDHIEFLDGTEHPELAGTFGTATRVGKVRLLADSDKLGCPVSISLEQVRFIERQPEPATPIKPRRSRSARSKDAEYLAAPSA